MVRLKTFLMKIIQKYIIVIPTIFLALFCVFNGLTAIATSKTILNPSIPISYEGWVLDWEENFDGNEIDSMIWSKIPRGMYDWNNTMSDRDQCFEYGDGKLIFKGIVNNIDSKDSSKYLTGGLYTKYKKSFKPGRFEFRVKLNSCKGAWPAIWLRPFDRGIDYPFDGEIDIIEHLNYDNYVYQSVHNYYITKLRKKEPKNQAKVFVLSDEYNNYGVDITPDSVVFHINGYKSFVYPNLKLSDEYGQYPFFQEWFILIDMQIGGTWVGPVDDTDLPVEMEIDWIKHYSKKLGKD